MSGCLYGKYTSDTQILQEAKGRSKKLHDDFMFLYLTKREVSLFSSTRWTSWCGPQCLSLLKCCNKTLASSIYKCLSLKTIATLVNYTCKNLVKLNHSHLVLHFCHLCKMCVKKCPNPGTSAPTLNAAIMAWRRVWLICGKPQRQMWSWIRDIPFFIDMNLGTSPTNALTSYRTTTFSIALAANLRLEIGQKLLILLVSKDGVLRPSNVTAGFRQSGTLLHLNDAITIFVITKRNIIRDW